MWYDSFAAHPEALAVGIGLILFAGLSYILKKTRLPPGPALLISFAAAVLAAFNLYRERFYGFEGTLIVVISLAIIGVFMRITWIFFKRLRSSFGA